MPKMKKKNVEPKDMYGKIKKDFDFTDEEIQKFKSGDYDIVCYCGGLVIVYVTDKAIFTKTTGGLDKILENDEEKEQFFELKAKLGIMQRTPIMTLLNKQQKKNVIYMLAEAHALILQKEYKAAKELIKSIEKYLEDRNSEIARKTHIICAFVLTFMSFVVFWGLKFVLNPFADCKTMADFIFLIPFGALGAMISIFLARKKKEEYNCECKFLNMLEVFVKIITGMVASLLAVCAYELDLIFTIFKEENKLCALIVICFAVGFSERFIPSLVKKFEISDEKNEQVQEL